MTVSRSLLSFRRGVRGPEFTLGSQSAKQVLVVGETFKIMTIVLLDPREPSGDRCRDARAFGGRRFEFRDQMEAWLLRSLGYG